MPRVVLSINGIFRPFVVSRRVPADRIGALRKAPMDVVKDKDFLADAETSKRTIVGPISGEEADAIVAEMYKTPPALIRKAAAAIEWQENPPGLRARPFPSVPLGRRQAGRA